MLRTRIPTDPGGDTLAQSRFSALRQFELLACRAQGDVDCTQDADFKVVFTERGRTPSRPSHLARGHPT